MTANEHAPQRTTTAPATIWLAAALALLTVLVIAQLVQTNRLRDDVARLNETVVVTGETSSGGSYTPDETAATCRLLGAIAKANGVQLSSVFTADATVSDCQQYAAEGARP